MKRKKTAWSRLSAEAGVRGVWQLMTLEIQCFIAARNQPCKAGSEQLQAQLSVLAKPNLPNPFQYITGSDIEEAANMVQSNDNEDIDIEVCTSLRFTLLFTNFVSHPTTRANY